MNLRVQSQPKSLFAPPYIHPTSKTKPSTKRFWTLLVKGFPMVCRTPSETDGNMLFQFSGEADHTFRRSFRTPLRVLSLYIIGKRGTDDVKAKDN
eukprot:scaffold41091_cov21-Cyclotella_meneghiniana.AAC.2